MIVCEGVSKSNAREIQPQNMACVGGCLPKHEDQYFGSCFSDKDCLNSCFASCTIMKCVQHECICKKC